MSIPPSVQSAFASLDPQAQKAFRREYSTGSKSTLVAYLFWILIGFHYLYLGRIGTQFAFWFTAGGFVIWWIIDFFRIPGLVRSQNHDRARLIMSQFKAMQ
jgi:TM2 domain-containing membrane protein YozV